MKLSIIKYVQFSAVIALIIAGTTSCHKDLYTAPINATYSAEFWTSQANVEEAAAAMYGQLRSCLRATNSNGVDQLESSYFIYGDMTTSTFSYAGNDVFLNYGLPATNNPPYNFSYVPYWESVLQDWSRFYSLIAICNLVLENVPAMPASDFSSEQAKNEYIAEAYFVRAYAYFYIIRVWGDPVYVSKTYNDVDYGHILPLARSPENNVLDSCLRDLRIARNNLVYAGGDPSKTIRANRGSAEALMAHMYEWQHNYDSAHFYCQQVINNGQYSLEPMASYTNIWKGMSSNESIFELPMLYSYNDPNFITQYTVGDANSVNNAEANFNCFGAFLKGSIVDNIRTSCWIAPQGGLVDNGTLYDTSKDLRFKTIFTFQNSSNGDPAGYMLLKYTNFAFQNPGTNSNPYINNDLVLIRLADIYLLDAEALAYKGDLTGAAHDLSFTENRAGINSYTNPTNQYDMIDEVVEERGRELIGEGQWYYDLIRTEYTQHWLEYVGYPADRVTAANKGYYWPLDLSTLFPYDNLLTQNPWWTFHSGR